MLGKGSLIVGDWGKRSGGEFLNSVCGIRMLGFWKNIGGKFLCWGIKVRSI